MVFDHAKQNKKNTLPLNDPAPLKVDQKSNCRGPVLLIHHYAADCECNKHFNTHFSHLKKSRLRGCVNGFLGLLCGLIVFLSRFLDQSTNLFDVQIGRDLIVIAGMGGIVLDVFLGNHAHLQERTEDKGVIVKDGLLHPDSQGGAFAWVEFLAQLFF